MGMDLLDLNFRLERRLHIRIPRWFWNGVWNREQKDVQIGAIFEALLPFVSQAGHPICGVCDYDLTGNQSGVCPECGTIIPDPEKPEGIWLALRDCLVDAVGARGEDIVPNAWLIKDLGSSC